MRRLVSSLLSFLGWVYLLRIPILTGFGFAGVCYLAFTHAKSHMGGAFDINSYVNIFLVSLIAFLFASAVEIAWRLVRCYGPARFFDRDPCAANPGGLGSLGYLLLIAIVAFPPIGGAIYKSTWPSFSADICKDRFIYGKDDGIYECTVLSLGGAVGCAFLGFVVYLGCVVIVATVQLGFGRPGKYGDYEVYDDSQEKVGRVGNLFIDETDGTEYMDVRTGFLGSRSTLIPSDIVNNIDDEGRRITVSVDRDQVEGGPAFDDNREITPEFQSNVYSHYGLEREERTEQPNVRPAWKKHDVIPDVFLLSAVQPLKHYFNWLRYKDLTKQFGLTERAGKIERWIRRRRPGLGCGYLNYEGRRPVSILPGHITALALFVLTFLIYFGIGIIDFFRLKQGTSTIVPTLGYVLLLFTLLCWGFSILTFFLDRYRIPVLVPLVAVLWITSFGLPGLKSDYYYPVAKPVQSGELVPQSELPKKKLPEKKIIVVAATGGGIQSATWTARVLTGLEEECRKEKCHQSFDESIRLISAVSGGSVGTMYFVNEYKGGHLPDKETHPLALKKIVRRAQSSSLDYAVWGLLYPDLARLFIPLPVKLSWDRGRALEEAWLRQQETQNNEEGLEDKLSEWRKDTRAGVRPAVIFNTTITETGHRLPLTTTEPIEGRLEHEDLLAKNEPKTDVSVVTATRLSAAWPYVSPAARANVKGSAPHLVDGGYYDNYGIASLVEWLDDELEREKQEDTPDIKKVLVVEIRAAGKPCANEEVRTSEEQTTKEKTSKGASKEETTSMAGTQARDENINKQIEPKRGWFYQAYAPPGTALKVRGPAQLGSNEVALDLLRDKWDKKKENEDEDVDIIEAHFSFDGTDVPTSWHLTEKQKLAIHDSWEAELTEKCNMEEGWNKVYDFLKK